MTTKMADSLTVQVGAGIRHHRKKKGLSQAELADLLGIEQHSLSRMEKGVIAPKFSRLRDIAQNLDCSVIDLFKTDESVSERVLYIEKQLQTLPSPFQQAVLRLLEDTVQALKKMTT